MSAGPEYVIVDGVAYPKAGTFEAGKATEHLSGQMSGKTADSVNVSGQKSGAFEALKSAHLEYAVDSQADVDPVAIEREFVSRWQAYIRANFRNLLHIQKSFKVSEKTARNWWDGKCGPNGAKTAVAKRITPIAAENMLYAAE